MRLSFSLISSFQQCMTKYKNYYKDEMVTIKRKDYFTFGEAVHNYLHDYYHKLPFPEKKIEDTYNKVNKGSLSPEELRDLSIDKAAVTAICSVYGNRYKNDFHRFKNFMCEKDATIDLDKEHSFYGQIDILACDHKDNWWILETKTTSMIENGYFDRIAIDNQVSGYVEVAKQILGKRPAGIIYNVIKKPTIRQKQTETIKDYTNRVVEEYTQNPDKYFIRQEFFIDGGVVDKWKLDTILMAKIIKGIEDVDHYPMNTNSCLGKYGTCEYLPKCTSGKYSAIVYEKKKPRK